MNPHQALIETAEKVVRIEEDAATDMIRMGYNPPEILWLADLKAAISSAKAAEDGVEETMYRVDVMDEIGWVMTTSDRFHSTEVSAYARADRTFGSAEKVKAVRVVRVESKSTVISVREKEGL